MTFPSHWMGLSTQSYWGSSSLFSIHSNRSASSRCSLNITIKSCFCLQDGFIGIYWESWGCEVVVFLTVMLKGSSTTFLQIGGCISPTCGFDRFPSHNLQITRPSPLAFLKQPQKSQSFFWKQAFHCLSWFSFNLMWLYLRRKETYDIGAFSSPVAVLTNSALTFTWLKNTADVTPVERAQNNNVCVSF